MRVILDASALWHPSVVRAQVKSRLPVVLPTVALMERARRLRLKKDDPTALLSVLKKLGIETEPFGVREALGSPSFVADGEVWRSHARDAMIAGHLGVEDVLVTANDRDFRELGVDPARLIVITEKARVTRDRRS